MSQSVLDWMNKGDFHFANPSSIHTSGKKAKARLLSCGDYLHEVFRYKKSHQLFFHSGASEGNNTLIKGLARFYEQQGELVHYFCASTDHSSVINIERDLIPSNHDVTQFEVKADGYFDKEKLILEINQSNKKIKILNYTWVNNETGIIWPLDWAEEIKEKTGCFIHVDAVQSIGKIENWEKISSHIDAYTYSGHKFGALKGVGFSFVKDDFPFLPFVRGGGQQNGMRSGTENTFGIYSIELALKDMVSNQDLSHLKECKDYFENHLKELLGEKGQVICLESPYRNLNTINFIIYNSSANDMLIALDLAGLEVGTGSACSSGAMKPSRVLIKMGYSEKEAAGALRISMDPMIQIDDVKEIIEKLSPVIERFL